MSSTIQEAHSTPPYIDEFLKKNMIKLVEIHDQGIEEHKTGCLGFKCSQTENKMDVFFMNEDIILQQLQKESWENLKQGIGNKKLFLIQDIDENRIFLVYI
ncbi:MAG: hypothetical protein CL470_09010 [Acidimicrobiaceae bacterium]|nr:hypothetical protein [Acidimicrobiaceae bacterium]|tara:strand:- start:498 stop:800 length:303 start_codon:yes stop_codon:yes gene_type:complete